MIAVYIETSAILSWLFNEPDAETVRTSVDKADRCVSSVIVVVETERALRRVLHEGLITPADHRKLLGLFREVTKSWSFLEVTEPVRIRASESFPVEPVRTLDALHLASALELQSVYSDLEVLSFDQRLSDNLIPLGLRRVND